LRTAGTDKPATPLWIIFVKKARLLKPNCETNFLREIPWQVVYCFIVCSLMIWLRYTFFLFALFFAAVAAAQNKVSVHREAERIDSLLLYFNLTEAADKADTLLTVLNKAADKRRNLGLRLRIMNARAKIYVLNRLYTEGLKLSLDIVDQAKEHNYPGEEYQASLTAALIYEINKDYITSKSYLDNAQHLYVTHELEALYSTYCVRVSSYFRFNKQNDSAVYFAYKALDYATKYRNFLDLTDAYLLLNILLDNDEKGIYYGKLAASQFMKVNRYPSAAAMLANITRRYLNINNYEQAIVYSDSTMSVTKFFEPGYAFLTHIYKIKTSIFESLQKTDSALFYHKLFHEYDSKLQKEIDSKEIKRITEQYQNDKKEAIIKRKDEQIIFIIILFAIIAVASLLIVRKNRKISYQNKIITKQVDELVKMLEQKKVLLSELQHRVKNNLQNVISILEIQKESVDFNNIDELIRGNQNRIHSMALLHKKLSVSDNVNEVDLQRYAQELTDLVVHSYDNFQKKIIFSVDCVTDKISIEKALPIGLILVELLSNSMKHAFKGKNTGVIKIFTEVEKQSGKINLHYTDSGTGFDFNKTSSTGLGLEIIRGLIDQLNGTVTVKKDKSFELIISFLN
jgi:two-component sensor histidine kinase